MVTQMQKLGWKLFTGTMQVLEPWLELLLSIPHDTDTTCDIIFATLLE